MPELIFNRSSPACSGFHFLPTSRPTGCYGTFAYSILRAIGQMGLLGRFAPIRHPAKRRRIRTVIQELICLAARLISTGRRLILRFSHHCPVFAAFQGIHEQLAPAR